MTLLKTKQKLILYEVVLPCQSSCVCGHFAGSHCVCIHMCACVKQRIIVLNCLTKSSIGFLEFAQLLLKKC